MTQADRLHSTPPINTPVEQMRHRFLSTAAAVAAGSTAVTLANFRQRRPEPRQRGSPDPIFAMIAMHKKLTAEWQGLYDHLDRAEFGGSEDYVRRPTQLIRWRGYTIGASEIATRRATLLEAGEIDPATVEQEYLDAKARYRTQVDAGRAWDERTGLATLRNDVDRRVTTAKRCAERLSATKPATPAGTAALIQYVLDDDLQADESHWRMAALRSAVAALNGIGTAVQS
jgi:hypothetical protein